MSELGPQFAMWFDAVHESKEALEKNRQKLSAVLFFEKNKQFWECPNCGSKARWGLAVRQTETNNSLAHGAAVVESVVCDVCDGTVFRPEGYLLTTTEVVVQPSYWKKYFEKHKDYLASVGVGSFENFCRSGFWGDIARNSSAWMVCPECIVMFKVDRGQKHSYAQQWWDSGRKYSPPNCGPASSSAVKFY